MALALCMAVVMFCGVVADAQAAAVQKSFTKTANIKGGQACVLWVEFDLEEDANTDVTVAVSTTSKDKKLNVQAIIAGEMNGDPYFTKLDSKHKKGSFTVNVGKGKRQVYITNYGMGKTKVKITVSAGEKVLKFIKKQTIKEIA